MNYKIKQNGKDMFVIHDKIYDPVEAMNMFYEESCELLNEDFHTGGHIVGGYYFVGEPSYSCFVNADNMPMLKDKAKEYGCEVADNGKVLSYREDLSTKFMVWLSSYKPQWKISKNKAYVLPIVCRGETWASTQEPVIIGDVESDAYCIEHNWEYRSNGYYIIDCLVRNIRLVHSDRNNYNAEFSIEECQ